MPKHTQEKTSPHSSLIRQGVPFLFSLAMREDGGAFYRLLSAAPAAFRNGSCVYRKATPPEAQVQLFTKFPNIFSLVMRKAAGFFIPVAL